MKRAVSIAVQIARALSAAHEELIIHRDVKPANVMIAAHDTVKLLDFGIAKLRGAHLAEESGRAFGTLAYMSPEQLRGDDVDVREIGEKLNVRTVLEGSVRRAGDRVRISAQLVNTSDEYQLWYERWDRDLRDALAIEDEIARHIAEALELELTGRPATTGTRPTESTDAWELYLQGRRFFHQHRRKGFEVARQSFLRAIEIDPSNYDAHYIKGRVMFTLGKYSEAAKQFENACVLQPEAYDSWYLLGMASRKLGEERRARNAGIECVEAAKARVRQHPEDTRAWTMGAAVFAELGEPDRAADWVARALAIDPDESIISYNAACVYTGLGQYDDALRCLEMSIGHGGPFYGWMENDPDLDSLRGDPRFRNLMAKFGPQPG